jgi:hypothetical protein
LIEFGLPYIYLKEWGRGSGFLGFAGFTKKLGIEATIRT